MTKARVPLWGKPNGFVVVDPSATPGAVVGQNLLWPDGRPVTEAQLRAVAQPPAPGTAVTYWRTIMEVPPNVQAVAALDAAGFVRRTGDGVWSAAAISNPDLAGADTDGLSEGASNLYFTDERADARVEAGITEHVAAENPHPQYARLSGFANSDSVTWDIDPVTGEIRAIAESGGAVDSVNGQTGEVLLDTDDVGEGGGNLYFTDDRADARVALGIDAHVSDPNPHPQYVRLSGFADSASVSWQIDPNTGAVSATADAGNTVDSVNGYVGEIVLGTDDIAEGSANAYFTNARVDARVQAANYTIGGAWAFQQNITVGSMTVGNGPVGTAANSSNVAIGQSALNSRTTATDVIAIGARSLAASATAGNNIAIGSGALQNLITGNANLALGDAAGAYLDTAWSCTFVGGNSGLSGSAVEAVAVGYDAGRINRAGQYTAVGARALLQDIAAPGTGQFSVAIGYRSGEECRAGECVYVGSLAGLTENPDNKASTSSSCTFIGHSAGLGSPVQIVYGTAIGARAAVTTSNTVVLGRTTDTAVIGATGNDGSGSKLQVTGAIKSTTEYRVGANKVVGARDTGWAAMTGTGSKAAIAAAPAGTASAAYAQTELQNALNRIAALEARMRSLDAALTAHGLIGA